MKMDDLSEHLVVDENEKKVFKVIATCLVFNEKKNEMNALSEAGEFK